MKLLEIKNVKKSFGAVDVLHDISLSVEQGEVVAIIGPSGSGKSTLLRCATLLETMDEGELVYLGEHAVSTGADGKSQYVGNAELKKIQGYFGLVFQNFNLFPHYSVLKNLMDAPVHVQKRNKEEVKKEAMELLEKMGLSDKADCYPCQLSGGQQQRVAIARTLAPEPQVLFMDEPLSNLDAKLRLEMRYELQRLHVETGSTFVYVTHDQMEAMTLATKICLINNGVLQQYEAPLTVYSRPNNLFVADFVGNPSINFIEAKGVQNENGSLDVTILDGRKAKFVPKEHLDLQRWFAERDKNEADEAARHKEKMQDKKAVEKSNKDEVFKYHIARVNEDDYALQEAPVITNEDFVIGVRPEALQLHDGAGLDGVIYGAMPTGMESTIKLRIGDFLLTGVVFGNTAYKIGQEVKFEIGGEDILLFDRKSGKLITAGRLQV